MTSFTALSLYLEILYIIRKINTIDKNGLEGDETYEVHFWPQDGMTNVILIKIAPETAS